MNRLNLPNVVTWEGDALTGRVVLLDQTRLPGQEIYVPCDSVEKVHECIRSLRVRGAPAIGVAAAYGLVVAGQMWKGQDVAGFNSGLEGAAKYLDSSRPTAVNLSWALARMVGVNAKLPKNEPATKRLEKLLEEAKVIDREDRAMCQSIGQHGNALVPKSANILTHCNAGMLATAGIGTALGVIYEAHASGKNIHVYADETRPLFQGSRLTAWELQRAGVPCTVICDNMSGMLMRNGKVDMVFVGADRIAANGDTANKIGTYSVAVLAKHHGIPFYVVAPSSTFDLKLKTGEEIPIEERNPDEVTRPFGFRSAPERIKVHNPAFDITPCYLISGIITEKGIINLCNGESETEILLNLSN